MGSSCSILLRFHWSNIIFNLVRFHSSNFNSLDDSTVPKKYYKRSQKSDYLERIAQFGPNASPILSPRTPHFQSTRSTERTSMKLYDMTTFVWTPMNELQRKIKQQKEKNTHIFQPTTPCKTGSRFLRLNRWNSGLGGVGDCL